MDAERHSYGPDDADRTSAYTNTPTTNHTQSAAAAPTLVLVLCKSMRPISHVALLSSGPSLVRFLRDFLNINRDFAPAACFPLSALPSFRVRAHWREPSEEKQWFHFLDILFRFDRVGVCDVNGVEFLIIPPPNDNAMELAICYRPARGSGAVLCSRSPNRNNPLDSDMVFAANGDNQSHNSLTDSGFLQPGGGGGGELVYSVRIHPSILEILGEMHSNWVFGALAELIDNSRDAGAGKVEVSIKSEYYEREERQIPVLTIQDDGSGMTYDAMVAMLSFCGVGRGRGSDIMGLGFKTGAMRLGRDALVLTQSRQSCCVGLLSRSFNEGKPETEIPMLCYVRYGHHMELDLALQSRPAAERNLEAVKAFSPFNEYSIGQQFLSLEAQDTATKIFIYNLDTCGGDNFSLEWDDLGDAGIKRKDIRIRSRRQQRRAGQMMSADVPLDYSLQAYLEVLYVFPRMKMYVQGSEVKVRPVANSLRESQVLEEKVMGAQLSLSLGMVERERKLRNSGVFVYWQGRLIEAYKRVGGMLCCSKQHHDNDISRGVGVLGVVDVTELMLDREGRGRPLLLNNKQGFMECHEYDVLEQWLGDKADFYCQQLLNHPMRIIQDTESA